MKLFLGIDTSNYTTSLCLLRQDGEIVADQRQILKVGPGLKGLRQSEAVFQHVQNLPVLTARLGPHLRGEDKLAALGVSTKPRAQTGSYLPVFLPGHSLALSLANLFGLTCYELTHQENHIWSGLASAGLALEGSFLAIHLSGGTTELVLVQPDRGNRSLRVDLWGGTLDLHAGQLVDRLGVKLGLSFPCGPALEKLALEAEATVPVATYQKAGRISFSGPLTALEKLVGEVAAPVIALTSFRVITRTLIKWISWAEEKTQRRRLLLVGGVAANKIIRRELVQGLPGWQIFFAAPAFSTDNAYGAAYYAALASGDLED